MLGKNITEKRWIVVIVALIIIFSGVVVSLSIQGLASTKSNNLTDKTIGLTQDIGGYKNVFGYNSTGKDPAWVPATLTPSTLGGVSGYTLAFPKGFNVTNIVIFQKNPQYDIQGLLNRSYLFTTMNIATTNTTLQSAVLTFGQQVNDSSLKALADKGVIEANSWASTVIYNAPSNTNNLNTSIEMNTLGLLTSNFKDFGTIEMTVNSTHSFTNTSVVSIQITQSFGQPFDLNIISISQVVMLVLGVILIFGIIVGLPRRRER